MKIGNLVKLLPMTRRTPKRVGVVLDLIDKKCWRTDVLGNKVDWNKVSPEPHAVVLVDGRRLTLPLVNLEAINDKV
tara:strand:- start:335 stop:562 length:228 start_codon:yes stop_codon:yes gene_type:complete